MKGKEGPGAVKIGKTVTETDQEADEPPIGHLVRVEEVKLNGKPRNPFGV